MGRPPWPREKQKGFWRHVAAGVSITDAAAAVGVSRPVVYRWFAASGGVMMPRAVREPASPSQRLRHGRRLSQDDREEIAHLNRQGTSLTQIAAAIGFDKSTVSRELRRNTSDGRYRATTAQREADTRLRLAQAKPAKLAANTRLREEVERRLKLKQSPEQIANRLRLDFPDDPEMRVSHETIYTSIYVQGRGALRKDLAGHLRTGRALRKPRAQARERTKGLHPLRNVISISQRPPCVEDRAVPGHWEGDLITGTSNRSAIGTLVERATGFLALLHLPGDHCALTMQTAICDYMATLPEVLRQTLTWDRGVEMTNHVKIAEATGLDIYFADPGSPWQRGSNENTNGLLRQYFPKGTDLSLWGPGYLQQVALEMNNRPRKRLDWHTPAEALDQLLSEHNNPPGVALTS